MNIESISVEKLKRAVALKEQIVALENELKAILSGSDYAHRSGMSLTSEANRKPGRKIGGAAISEEGRRRIAEAQKLRWAKIKRSSKNSTNTPIGASGALSASAKRAKTMSPEVRRKIAEALKARWAERKAGI